MAGSPASTINKRGNPARAMRSRLRLEEFEKRKLNQKGEHRAVFGEQMDSKAAVDAGETRLKPAPYPIWFGLVLN